MMTTAFCAYAIYYQHFKLLPNQISVRLVAFSGQTQPEQYFLRDSYGDHAGKRANALHFLLLQWFSLSQLEVLLVQL
mgnify:CR=1 FL=1